MITKINFEVFEQLRKRYNNLDFPFLNEHRIFNKNNKPYQGLKILHNIPLTCEAVIKAEALLLGGADVTMSCINIFDPQKEAIEVLKSANVKINLEKKITDQYDFYLDCCGELLDFVPPKIGTVELTQTGSERYKNAEVDYPIISVDDSKLKLLETIFGTSEGFIHAIDPFFAKGLYNLNIIVFGYGKVGTGIVSLLLKYTDLITVIDINDLQLQRAKRKGIKVISSVEKNNINKALNGADLIITATGVKNVLSNYYNLDQKACRKAILANMGAEDEYGENFQKEAVLFDKKPLNFSTPKPTTIKCIDPILYAHNISIDLINSGKFSNGYNKFPPNIADSIFKKWCNIHRKAEIMIEAY